MYRNPGVVKRFLYQMLQGIQYCHSHRCAHGIPHSAPPAAARSLCRQARHLHLCPHRAARAALRFAASCTGT